MHNGQRVCGLYFYDHLILNLKHLWNHCGHSGHNNVDIYFSKSIILSKEMFLAMSAFGIFDKILEKYSICDAKFDFLNNPPQILNMCL